MKSSARVADMTSGSPAGHILRFALPLIIGNIFQQLYNLVDCIIVGKYVGSDPLAAVGACGSVNFLFFSLCSGLSIGIGVIVSQFFGARQENQVRRTIANAFYVLISAALAVSVISYLAAPGLLAFLDTPKNIIHDSVTYMRTSCFGIIGIALYNGVSAILRALGDSRTPLYFLILSSICNITLDLFFVLSLGLGVFGVALATILSQYVAAAACLLYSFRRVSYFHFDRELRKPDLKIIKTSYRLGIPVALQSGMISISCIALQAVVNSFGSTVCAAFTITNRAEQLVNQPYNSLCAALTTYAGQNIGAGKPERVRLGFRQSIFMVAVFSACMIPVAYLFGADIAALFVEEQEVIALGAKALRITSLFYFFLGMIYVPRGILNGCGDAGFSVINGLTEVICRVVFSRLLTGIAVIGCMGIWMTSGLTWFTVSVVCVLRYVSGVWKSKGISNRK